MSDEGYEPLYDDDGQHAGWLAEAEDGALVGISLDGEIVGALDPDGTPVDHTVYEIDNGADPYADLQAGYDQLEQRIAAQEQQEPAFSYIPPPDTSQEEVESWQADASDIEYGFDRSMTRREKAAIATHAHVNGLSLLAAAEDLASRGRSPLIDIDSGSEHARRAARAQLMAEHLTDATDPADPEGVRQATRASYDLDNREQRQAYMADRLEGRDLDGSTVYNGSDSYPTTEEETWTDGDLD